MSTLKYDSNTKSGFPLTGALALKGDVSYDDLNVYGAWSGKEWTMGKEDHSFHPDGDHYRGQDQGRQIYLFRLQHVRESG